MSREIKFRVWSRVFKKFTDGYENQNRVNYDELYSDPPGLFLQALSLIRKDGDYVLQQYTGFKDKNGKDIYEGDIISYEECVTDGIKSLLRPISVIVWSHGSWYVSLNKLGKYKFGHQLLMFAGNTTVLGNIFENPELIQ